MSVATLYWSEWEAQLMRLLYLLDQYRKGKM